MSKDTLQLPKTAFSMKASLPLKEPEILKKWEKNKIFEKLRKKSKGKEKFVLHDGPPYANGNIHMGTALNKILKDILKPMPIGDFKSASQKVKSNRNPFQKPEKSELSSLDDIYSTLIFKGIARSGDELLAIIETDNVQKFYEVGDLMDNGFTIDSISYEETSVEVSNGSRKYKLILSGFHEGALAARACFKLARPNEKYRFEFTTSSKTIKNRLGVKGD